MARATASLAALVVVGFVGASLDVVGFVGAAAGGVVPSPEAGRAA